MIIIDYLQAYARDREELRAVLFGTPPRRLSRLKSHHKINTLEFQPVQNFLTFQLPNQCKNKMRDLCDARTRLRSVSCPLEGNAMQQIQAHINICIIRLLNRPEAACSAQVEPDTLDSDKISHPPC